ncbi:cell growth regulator with EF hand domain protein 1 [Chlamydotis macqueenii]
MRSPRVLLLLLLLLGPAARAAPRAAGQGPEVPAATGPDPDPDPFSPELLPLPLLRSAVRGLGPPERDAEAMTREQALLYLFALHDHDGGGRLDGLELLQLLGAVLARRDGGRPRPEAVAALVDRALERRDLSGDGLLEPPELLLPPRRGPPGQPRGGQAGGGSLAEGQADPRAETAEREGAPSTGPIKAAEAPGAGPPDAEEAPEAEAPGAEAVEAEEAPRDEAIEAEAPEGVAAPVQGDAGEG